MTDHENQKKETPRECTLSIRCVPVEVRKKFKVMCAKEGVSMQEKIINLMKDATK